MSAAVEGSETFPDPHVTAVIVSHDGARWLPQVLDALERQRRMPDALVAVDTGSTDGTVELLADRMGAANICRLDRYAGFGDAVAAGLDHVDNQAAESRRHAHVRPADLTNRSHWIWLLHDDSAPDPGALGALLAEIRGDVAVVGPKIREWPSLRRLLEVGATISGTGQRETGLERGEPDQGQHDRPRDVLAVNTAGMLVRRDVWDELGGLDPRLPLFGDDLDFGWRMARAGHRTRTAPDAVVFHLEAATHGLRVDGAYSRRPVAERRRAALFTLLANASRLGFWWQSVRLLVGSLLRVLGLLLAKAPREAADELRGLAGVYLRPFAMLRARRQRHRQAKRSSREVRHLLPSPWLPYRHGVDAVLDIGLALIRAVGGGGQQPQVSGKRAVVETGPVAVEAEELPTTASTLARLLRQPLVLIGIGLVVLSAWSARDLLGTGQLAGGALLPAPDGVGGWWSLVWQSWHPVGIGSDDLAAPYVALLATGGTVTFGQPWLLVDLLVLAVVPLCALTASRLARRLFESRRVRIWWCVTYASLPVLTGAVAQGRIGSLVGVVVLPLVVSAALGLFVGGRSVGMSALRLGLWLSVLVAFVPLSYLMVALALGLAAFWWPIAGRGRARSLATVVGVLALPWLLLGQWMWDRAVDPAAMWWEAGLAQARMDGVAIDLAPGLLDLVGGQPGGPGGAPVWLGLVVVGLGAVALGRTDRMRVLAVAWLVALVGLGFAVLGAGQRVDVGLGAQSASVWVGFPLVWWIAGAATAAGLAADRIGDFLAGHTFGWRQPMAVGASVIAALVPVAFVGWWAWGDDSVLQRADPVPVPVYLADRAAGPQQSATLVLSGAPDDGLGYQIVRDDGTRLGEESVLPESSELVAMDAAVADVLSSPDAEAVGYLLDQGIGAVYALPPVDATVESVLDGATGLTRAGTTDPDARAWDLVAPSGAIRLVPADGSTGEAEVIDGPAALHGDVDLPEGGEGGQLRLAAAASDQWTASGPDDELQPQSTTSGTQAFAAPNGGTVSLAYDSNNRLWTLAQLACLFVAVVLALPGRRRGS
jgi:GT2 family glycosyltransferase